MLPFPEQTLSAGGSLGGGGAAGTDEEPVTATAAAAAAAAAAAGAERRTKYVCFTDTRILLSPSKETPFTSPLLTLSSTALPSLNSKSPSASGFDDIVVTLR